MERTEQADGAEEASSLTIDLRDAESGEVDEPSTGIVIDLREAGGFAVRPAPSRVRAKRVFDVVFASLALLVSAPLMAGIAAIIKLTSRGPVLFKHERLGLDGEAFACLKFRTMVDGADRMLNEMLEEDESLRRQFEEDFKLREDPRITPIGSWLRRTSLDELPQFWNVLRGDMSVVGPRPIVRDELARYGRWQDTLLSVRPGVTGPWQVSGRNDVAYDLRVALDVGYVNQQTFRGDLGIIVKTVGVLFKVNSNGAY